MWQLQGLLRAEHLYYKERGLYDFPQRRPGRMLGLRLLGALLRSRRLRRVFGGRLNDALLAPYKKVLDKLSQEGSP